MARFQANFQRDFPHTQVESRDWLALIYIGVPADMYQSYIHKRGMVYCSKSHRPVLWQWLHPLVDSVVTAVAFK